MNLKCDTPPGLCKKKKKLNIKVALTQHDSKDPIFVPYHVYANW